MRYDNAPTVAELLGLDAPDLWRGKSVLRPRPSAPRP